MPDNQHVKTHHWAGKAVLPVLLGGVLLLTGLAYWRGNNEAPGGTDSSELPYLARVHSGQAAPPFRAATLTGREVKFPQDFSGKLVLLDFWATWCPPCRAEFPHLQQAYERFHTRGLEIIGISLDAPNGISADSVRRFLRDNNASWKVVYAGAGEIAGAYRVTGIPAAFLVDGETGVILARDSQLRGHALLKTIKETLLEKSRG